MSVSKLSLVCERLIEAGWLAALIVTPLFFNLYSRRGFEADKTALLRSIVVVMTAAWLVKWIDQRRVVSRPRQLNAAQLLMLGLIAGYTLITLTSIAPNISLFGSYTRQQGTYTLVSYAVLFGLIAQELRTRSQLERLINTLILTSVPVALYAVVQANGLDPLASGTERVSATIGNPIYLAAYLLMTFFVTVGKAIECWQAKRSRRGWATGVYAGLAALQLAAFGAAGSRGPFVGWLAGSFFFSLILALLYRRRRLVIGALSAGLMAIVLLVLINLPASPLAGIRTLPGIGRLFDLTTAPGDSGTARTLIWDGSASLVQPHAPLQFPDGASDPLNVVRPLIGYGPESMYLVFQQYFPPALVAETGYAGDTFVGRSHNETWDALVTGGMLGLAIYQGVMIFVVTVGLRGLGLLLTTTDRNWLVGLWLVLGGIGGLSAGLLGGWRFFGLGLPIGTLMGLMIYLLRCAARSIPKPDRAVNPNRGLLAALLVASIAHYVEIQLGIAVVTSNLIFWTLAAVSVVISRNQAWTAEPQPTSYIGRAAGYGVTAAVISVTLLYAFITNYEQITNPAIVLWRSLTYNSLQKTDSAAILWLILAIWAVTAILMQLELAASGIIRQGRERVWATLLLLSLALGLSTGFGLLLAAQPGLQPQISFMQLSDLTQYANDRLGLFNLYILATAVLLGLLTGSLLADRLPQLILIPGHPRAVIALWPIGLAALWWVSASNLDMVRADMIYKQGQSFEAFSNWDYALPLYQQSIAYAPGEDTYYRGLGQVFIDKSATAANAAPARFDMRTPVTTVLALNWEDVSQLTRTDCLYAAIAVFTYAQQIDPLNADHAAGLALAYRQLAAATAGADEQAVLKTTAQQLYARALQLRPQDAKLQAMLNAP